MRYKLAFGICLLLAIMGMLALHVSPTRASVEALKRGVDGAQNTTVTCSDVATAHGDWYYNWEANPLECPGVESVPMIWGSSVPSAVGGRSNYILGANEPNEPTQANITPTQYVPIWHTIETTYYPTYTLVSPVPSQGQNQWLINFRNAYTSTYGYYPRLGALAVHCYADNAAYCISLITNTESLATSWGVTGGVWLTEWALWSHDPTYCPTPVSTAPSYPGPYAIFLPLVAASTCTGNNIPGAAALLNYMVNDPSLTHYAWYATKTDDNYVRGPYGVGWNDSMIDFRSGALTNIGQLYTSIGW